MRVNPLQSRTLVVLVLVLLGVGVVSAVFAHNLPTSWLCYTDPSGTGNPSDVLNVIVHRAYGSWEGIWDAMLYVGWSSTSANAVYCKPETSWVAQHVTLAKGDFFCGSTDCRNHARLYGDPDGSSTTTVITASTEHWDWGFLAQCPGHKLDSFDRGREGFVNDFLASPGIVGTKGWLWVGNANRYGNCKPPGDPIGAWHDGWVRLVHTSNF